MTQFKIYETDERMYFLQRILRGVVPETTAHVFAPNIVVTEERLTDVKDGEILICGKLDKGAEIYAQNHSVEVHTLSDDEKFQADNALLTAEGALGIIIDHTMLSLGDIYALVIGFGRTGAAVCRLFDKLDVRFDIATSASPRPAGAFARRVVTASEADLSAYDVIVNTAPQKIISDEQALSVKPSVVYVELASAPALNLKMLQNLGIDAEKYPALPAKCSPESAAKAMETYIRRVVKCRK